MKSRCQSNVGWSGGSGLVRAFVRESSLLLEQRNQYSQGLGVSEFNLDCTESTLVLNTYSGSQRLSCQNENCGKNDEAFHIYVSYYRILIVFVSMLSYCEGLYSILGIICVLSVFGVQCYEFKSFIV